MKPSKLFRSAWLITSLVISGLVITSPVVAGEATWIDVRTAKEFNQGHVLGAANISYEQIRDIGRLGLDQDEVIYLYCRSGRRAGIAQQALEELGFTQVKNVGSLEDALAWADAAASD